MNGIPTPGVFLGSGEPVVVQKARKALFLDRDGVINVNHGYVHTADQTEWVPGIFELCKTAASAGYALVVVTNQAGIARGYYSEEAFRQYTSWLHEQFELRGIHLSATYYCPHHPEFGVGEFKVQCNCRKPGPGMLLAAADDLFLDLGRSVLVGDMPSDLEAAKAAGVRSSFFVDAALADVARIVDDGGDEA